MGAPLNQSKSGLNGYNKSFLESSSTSPFHGPPVKNLCSRVDNKVSPKFITLFKNEIQVQFKDNYVIFRNEKNGKQKVGK